MSLFTGLALLGSGAHAAPEISVQTVEGATTVPLTSGTVATWGSNASSYTTPAGLAGVVSVVSGSSFYAALKGDNTLTIWNRNPGGAAVILDVPAGVQGQTTAIAAGDGFMLARKADGTVAAWGFNTDGQCDVPAGLTGVVSVAAGSKHGLALKSDGTVVGWGAKGKEQAAIPAGLTGVTAIAAVSSFSYAVKADGTVVNWSNISGYTPPLIPAGLSGVREIAGGALFALALKQDGTVAGIGSGSAFLIPAGASGIQAVAASTSFSLFLKADGTLLSGGTDRYLSSMPPDLTGVKAIHMSSFNRAVVRDSVVEMGNTAAGASSAPRVVTVRNDGNTPLNLNGVLMGEGSSPAFTVNTAGMAATLAPGASTTFTVTFTPQAAGRSVGRVRILSNDADEKHFEILFSGHSLSNIALFRGNSTAPVDQIAQDTGVETYADQSLGTTSAAKVFTIRNDGIASLSGLQLSLDGEHAGDFSFTAPPATTLAPGATTTFTASFTPTAHFPREARLLVSSNDPDENPFIIRLTGKATAPDIILENAGGALLENARLIGWGKNDHQQTTVPDGARYSVASVATGTGHTVVLKRDGTLRAWGDNSLLQTDIPSDIGTVREISAGLTFTTALRTNGSLRGWGSTSTVDPFVDNGVAISVGAEHGIALLSNGRVRPWGSGTGSNPLPLEIDSDIKAISAGFGHNVALRNDGTVVSWYSTSLPSYQVPGLSGITAVSAGDGYSLALGADQTVWHWTVGGTPVKLPVTGAVGISAGASHYAILRHDGTVTTYGNNADGRATVPPGLSSVRSIHAGDVNTMAIVNGRLPFGNVPLDTTSPPMTVFVKNNGNASLHLTSVSVVSGRAADYTVDTTGMTTTIPAGGQTSFKVSFSPGGNGLRHAVLRVANDDPDAYDHEIDLAGYSMPEIGVFTGATTDASAARIDGEGTETFPAAPAGTSGLTHTFTIRNTEAALLGNLAVSMAGAHPADFTLTAPVLPRLAQGESTTFTVTFTPKASGVRDGTILITSNDADENPFRIHLTGSGTDPLAAWRLNWFNTADDTGTRALLADFDLDGMSNLLEYALGTDPTANTPASRRPAAAPGGPLTIHYTRPAGGVPGIIYQVQVSGDDLSDWTSAVPGVDYTQAIDDNGDGSETVTITLVPAHRFARISVIRGQ